MKNENTAADPFSVPHSSFFIPRSPGRNPKGIGNCEPKHNTVCLHEPKFSINFSQSGMLFRSRTANSLERNDPVGWVESSRPTRSAP